MSISNGKMKEGVSMDIILDKIRDDVTELYNTKILLTKNDLWNIKRDFGIREALEGRQHESDYVSLTLWIKKMELSDDNPVLFFKNQTEEDDNFILIISSKFQQEMFKRFGQNKVCIDSTHGTNSYDFYLTTLVVSINSMLDSQVLAVFQLRQIMIHGRHSLKNLKLKQAL